MRTNYVLIDLESVQPRDFHLLDPKVFKVVVFVGAKQARISFELASALQSMGEHAEYVKMSGTGKNSLDFHIAFYIGRLSEREPGAFFHIISKDKGFDPLIAHLRSEKILAARVDSIGEIPLARNVKAKTPEQRAEIYLEKLQQPKFTRPRKAKTLASSIATFFQRQLTEEEIQLVVAVLVKRGCVVISDGKVSYSLAA